jgi:hypothetical protein
VSFRPSLEQALRVLPPRDAARLFETADLPRLADHADLCDYLGHYAESFHTAQEVASLLRDFLAYLSQTEESLLCTGHPSLRFHNQWLYLSLAKLYYTTLPARTIIWSMSDLVDGVLEAKDGMGHPVQDLPEEHAEVGQTLMQAMQQLTVVIEERATPDESKLEMPDAVIFTEDGLRYPQPPDEWGLSANECRRLELLRPKLLTLKQQVIVQLCQALTERNPTGLWNACLDLITEALTGEEAEFCLHVDRIYTGYDLRTGQTIDPEAALIAGGLTDLLEFIGHCEAELTIGVMDRTKRSLYAHVQRGSFEMPGIDVHYTGSFPSYYEAIKRGWRAHVDETLALFLDLSAQEEDFWNEYRARVNQALEHEFSEWVTIQTKVKRKLISKFEPQVRTFAEWQRTQLETTGHMTILQLSPLAEPLQRGPIERMLDHAGSQSTTLPVLVPAAESGPVAPMHNESQATRAVLNGASRLPKRVRTLERWQVVWRHTAPLLRLGYSVRRIAETLKQRDGQVRGISEDTLPRIIAAGREGLLD